MKLAKNIAENRGRVENDILENYFDQGFNEGNLVDLIVAVGEKTITNMLHNVTKIPKYFPEVPKLEEVSSK